MKYPRPGFDSPPAVFQTASRVESSACNCSSWAADIPGGHTVAFGVIPFCSQYPMLLWNFADCESFSLSLPPEKREWSKLYSVPGGSVSSSFSS